MDRGDALAVTGPAEGAALIRVGAQLDEEPNRLDAIRLRRPDERLVEHLLRIVEGLPGGEAAVGTVEAAVRSSLWSTDELVDQLKLAEAGGDTEVDRLAAQ